MRTQLTSKIVELIGKIIHKDIRFMVGKMDRSSPIINRDLNHSIRARQRDLNNLSRTCYPLLCLLNPYLYEAPYIISVFGHNSAEFVNTLAAFDPTRSQLKSLVATRPLHPEPLGSCVQRIAFQSIENRILWELAIKQMTNLSELNVTYSGKLIDASVAFLANLNPPLTRLHLGDGLHITSKSIPAFVKLTRLEILGLAGNCWVLDSHAKQLITGLPHLRRLNLEGSSITDSFVNWLIAEYGRARELGSVEKNHFTTRFRDVDLRKCRFITRPHQCEGLTIHHSLGEGMERNVSGMVMM